MRSLYISVINVTRPDCKKKKKKFEVYLVSESFLLFFFLTFRMVLNLRMVSYNQSKQFWYKLGYFSRAVHCFTLILDILYWRGFFCVFFFQFHFGPIFTECPICCTTYHFARCQITKKQKQNKKQQQQQKDTIKLHT